MKEIRYRPAAVRALLRMPGKTALRIKGKIDLYAADPNSQANNVKSMSGQDGIRLRVGDWRVIMLEDEVLEIVDIGPRGSIYG